MKLTTEQLKQIIREELNEVFTPTKIGHYAKRAHKRRGAGADPEEIKKLKGLPAKEQLAYWREQGVDPEEIKKLGSFDRSDPEMAADIDDMYGIEQEPMPDEMGMPLLMMIQDSMDYVVNYKIHNAKKWGKYAMVNGDGYTVKDPDGTAWFSTNKTLKYFARDIVKALRHHMDAQIGNNPNMPFSSKEITLKMGSFNVWYQLTQQAQSKLEKMMQQGEARIGHDPQHVDMKNPNNKRVFFVKI